MPTQASNSAANLNALAKIISNAGLQRLLLGDKSKQYSKQVKNLLTKNGVDLAATSTYNDLLSASYQHLLQHYRHEYLYKTAILNDYVLKEHSLADTVILNEFKIASSKADVVVVNGSNKVFEIKTELDSPERLENQVNDYFKAFSEVYLVVHHSVLAKYLGLVDKHVGIMIFNAQNKIETVHTATADHSRLDVVTLFKALRKDEYLSVIKALTGTVPKVKPVQLFSECLAICSSLPIALVHQEFLKVIKQRINSKANEITLDHAIPPCLKFSCYHSTLTQNDYIALIKRLNYQF